MSTLNIKIPSPGESITEVQIATWFVSTGDYVEKNQELAELESDKATLTLVAEGSGVITLLAEANQTVDVGFIACTIDTSLKAPEKKEDKQAGEKKEATQVAEKKEIAKPQKQDAPEKSSVKITPLAKEMLKEKSISLADFLNKLDRITSKDIETVLSYEEGQTPKNKPINYDDRAENRQPMSPLRKKLSQRLVHVKNQTAMLTTFNEVNLQAVINIRNKYKTPFKEKYGVKLGFMSFFTKAASIALKKHPSINAMLDNDEIVNFNYNDIGIAVQTPKGLMVPIIRDVDKKSIAEIEISIATMAEKARNAKISLNEMSGGTFTITNGGVFGSLLSTPIINPPQSGILGMHNIIERPIAENSKVVIRPMMYTALSYDHRLVDGKDSVGFLVKLKELIENPERMLFNGRDAADELVMGS